MNYSYDKNILFLVTEDWYFISHRLSLALECKKNGYIVHVACKDTGKINEIKKYGFTCYNLKIYRGTFSVFSVFKSVNEIRRVIKNSNVSLIHAISMQSIIMSLVATIFNTRIKFVAAITGLGSIFLDKSLKANIIKLLITLLLIIGLKKKNVRVIVQNKDDLKFIKKYFLCPLNKIEIIRGSGIDINFYNFQREPSFPPINITYVGRLIEDKGIESIIEAFEIAYKKNDQIKLLLVGGLDNKNIRPISKKYIEERIHNNNSIKYLGEIEDIRKIWKKSHIAILASKREGLPKSLLEAAATGRAIISTDVPGSREIALNSINAETVKLGDNNALAKAILYLAENHNIRKNYGLKSRELVESDMSQDKVIKKTLNLYQNFC